VFHFNKKHLEDQTIPMWVLKFHGETLYVNHVDCTVPWSTKETPDNPSTKGSIKVKDVLLRVSDANEATISELTLIDKFRLRNQKLGYVRIMVREGKDFYQLKEVLKNSNIAHGPMKTIYGRCSSRFYITDILDRKAYMLVSLAMSETSSFREVKPNESYYQEYDNIKGSDIPVDYGHPSTPFEYS
jgi:hypothetical protein